MSSVRRDKSVLAGCGKIADVDITVEDPPKPALEGRSSLAEHFSAGKVKEMSQERRDDRPYYGVTRNISPIQFKIARTKSARVDATGLPRRWEIF